MSNRSTSSPGAIDEYSADRHGPGGPSDPVETGPGEEVDTRKWARYHLRVAVAAESVDEMEYHISMARQLLSKSLTEGTAQETGGPRTLFDDA